MTLPSTLADTQILIVGAGLAGLHCALRLSQKSPTVSITIAEAYNYVGGRVTTYKPKDFTDIHWENGAGRVHSSHKLVRSYIKRYKLHELQSNPTQIYAGSGMQGTNTWDSFSEIIIKTLATLHPRTLSSNTVQELLVKAYGLEKANELLMHFPYRAEVTTLRADLAIKSFQKEMGTNAHFSVVQEGLGAIIQGMRKELEERGVKFLLNHKLSAVVPDSQPIVCNFIEMGENTKYHVRISADKVILALHSDSLKKISPFANLPVLKHLSMKPLLRTYGIFETGRGGAWFKDMPKVVTDSPLRYIIPVNPNQGTIMTSYTDDDDTRHWMKLYDEGGNVLEKAITKELRNQFPEKKIPTPLYFKAHPWYQGCTYWLPGFYDPVEESKKVMCPQPLKWQNLYACGESFSLRQAWMEGALEHADAMLNKYFF